MNERAKQFSAFSPLRGHHELLKKKEHVIVPKRELTEDSVAELSLKLSMIKKGMMVKIIYYTNGEYLIIGGIVSKIDLYLKKLTIVKININFEDIYQIIDFYDTEQKNEQL